MQNQYPTVTCGDLIKAILEDLKAVDARVRVLDHHVTISFERHKGIYEEYTFPLMIDCSFNPREES